jgi:hypothetical protein
MIRSSVGPRFIGGAHFFEEVTAPSEKRKGRKKGANVRNGERLIVQLRPEAQG